MGAWIEIAFTVLRYRTAYVAPYMGAWIEMLFIITLLLLGVGRSLHGSVD